MGKSQFFVKKFSFCGEDGTILSKLSKKMKFWQYVVGGLLALLVFSAILIADNMQFAQRNSFSQNPFSLVGTSHADFGGEIQFLPSGEMVWIDEGAEVLVTENKRELRQGTIVLGGTFFETPEDTEITNRLWFGDIRLETNAASALVHLDSEGMATILSGGGALDLFFEGKNMPFVMPAHSELTLDIQENITVDPAIDYFAIKEKFSVASLSSGEWGTKLWQAEQALANWRAQFGHFAWNLPSLWETQNGVFLSFLERVSPTLPAEKTAIRAFQEATLPLQKARENGEDSSTNLLLENFKKNILNSASWESILQKSEQAQKEWTWFEFAQKFWLPVVSPDAHEQKFSVLWKDDTDSLSEKIRAINLLSHNERWLRAEKKLNEFASQFTATEFTDEDMWELIGFRRAMTNILQRFPVYRSIENFRLWTTLVRTEQKYLSPEVRQTLTLEVAHDILPFVAEFISKENDAAITQHLNALWIELSISDTNPMIFSSEERTTIQLIELVGVSGMTPEQAQKAQIQKQQREEIADQLEALLEENPDEEIVDMGISNAKKLWEFLTSEQIDIDISAFRTTRTETELTTRFANIAEGKRKIEGVFDYHTQKFIMLTLGEETTSDLSAHRLGRWIKNIGGKFESDSLIAEEDTEEMTEIIQTTPQAILSRKLVQELLKSLGIDAKREQIEMLDESYQKSSISRVQYKGAQLNMEYDLLRQIFSNISLQREGTVVSHAGGETPERLKNILNQLEETLPVNN